jgi:hypothetical protein
MKKPPLIPPYQGEEERLIEVAPNNLDKNSFWAIIKEPVVAFLWGEGSTGEDLCASTLIAQN